LFSVRRYFAADQPFHVGPDEPDPWPLPGAELNLSQVATLTHPSNVLGGGAQIAGGLTRGHGWWLAGHASNLPAQIGLHATDAGGRPATGPKPTAPDFRE
jgi:hypothetical protein